MIRTAAIAFALATSSLAIPCAAVAQGDVAPADPLRLKLAETMAAKIIPAGSYEKMMKDMSEQMVDGMMSQMLGMDASVFAEAAGQDGKALEGKSMEELASSADPHFKERMDIMMKVMFDEMGKLMSEMEPAARGALAKVYARKYSTQQLSDMNAFFATPSGTAFAGDFMSTFTDKEMMTAMMGQMPKLLEAMPAIMKKVEAATSHLPPAPKPDADTSMASDDADPEPYANETGEEPWYQDDSWTPSQRKNASRLAEIYARASEKSETAYAAYNGAVAQAVNAARQRLLAEGWTPAADSQAVTAEEISTGTKAPPASPE